MLNWLPCTKNKIVVCFLREGQLITTYWMHKIQRISSIDLISKKHLFLANCLKDSWTFGNCWITCTSLPWTRYPYDSRIPNWAHNLILDCICVSFNIIFPRTQVWLWNLELCCINNGTWSQMVPWNKPVLNWDLTRASVEYQMKFIKEANLWERQFDEKTSLLHFFYHCSIIKMKSRCICSLRLKRSFQIHQWEKKSCYAPISRENI